MTDNLCMTCRFNKPDGGQGKAFPQYRRCSWADGKILPHWIKNRIGMHPYDGGLQESFQIQYGAKQCDTYKKGRVR